MDDLGNILIKRLTKSPVYAVNTSEENSLDHEIIKLQNGLLEYEKPFKLFDMKKFQQNVNRELKRQYPERRWAWIQFSTCNMPVYIDDIMQIIAEFYWRHMISSNIVKMLHNL